jgi:transposase-like protein
LLEKIRWNGEPTCPYCGSKKYRKLKDEQRYQCNECYTSYSVTVNTIFHQTHVPLDKWFIALPLILEDKISVRELAKEINISKNTAERMVKLVKNSDSESFKLIHLIKNRGEK